MQQRGAMGRDNSSFGAWVNQRNKSGDDEEEEVSLLGQFASIQDGFAAQMNEMAGALPNSGPLSADFRERLSTSVHLLMASIGFLVLGLLVGLPTVVLKPSKFIMCMTLSTLLGAASVVVMRKPAVFLQELVAQPVESIPLIALLLASLFTVYVTVVVHQYVAILMAGMLQIFCMLWYISTFIPGGRAGLNVLLKTAFFMARASLTPCILGAKYAVRQMLA
jgi:hypothetical protein